MNASLRRGACPTLAAPMQTGDGLLARLNPVASGLSPNTLIGLCEAALRHGNGVVEVTARGSLHVRGLTKRSAGRLAAEVDALGIAVRSGVPVEIGPLAGLDPDETTDPRPVAEAVRKGVAAAGFEARLGPKVSVIVDGGGHSGLDGISADVRLTAVPRGSGVVWRVAAGGNAQTARLLGEFDKEGARMAALAILAKVAAIGREGRASKLSGEKLDTVRSVVMAPAISGKAADGAPPSVLPDISPPRGEIGCQLGFRQSPAGQFQRNPSGRPISPLVGEMSGRTEGGNLERGGERFPPATRPHPAILPLIDDRFAVAITLPFGHAHAEALINLVKSAEALHAGEVRLAPGRKLLFLCPSEISARSVQEEAAAAGFITDPSDPRNLIAACPGSPACASGHIPARAMAAEIAAVMPAGLAVELHVSGCEKRCARPGDDGLTLLGRPDGAAFVLGGRGTAPLAHVAQEHAVAAVGRVMKLIADQKKAGLSGERALARLGKDRLAQAFLGKD